MNKKFLSAAVLTGFFLLWPGAAHAYIGPGLGVVFLGYLFGPVAAVLGVVAIVLYFPLRLLYKKWRNKKNPAQEQAGDE